MASPIRISHIVLQTNNPKALQDWYCTVLEGEMVHEFVIIESGTASVRRGGRKVATVGAGDVLYFRTGWRTKFKEEKDALAVTMFKAWYVPFYRYGVIHGDPHLGNYTVRPDGSINLLDFGCVRIFPPRFVRGSIELYRALMSDDEARAVAAYEDWGFSGLSRDMIAVLNRWAAFLYGPLMDDRPRRLTEGMADGHGRDMAQNVFGELRKMGGVRPPREFVFMDRAAIGLGAVFIHLRASINWHRLFESLIEGFDVGALASRQDDALKVAGL